MKKIFYTLISLIFLLSINACKGYKPIFGSSNIDFKIVDYSISGDKKIGNKIYSKLYNLSKSSTNTPKTKNIYILINAVKNKNATSKNSVGKILGYKVNLSTKVTIKDILTGSNILSEDYVFSSSYKVQDLYSETLKLENRSIENLINKTYQDLLIKLSENILQ